MKKASIYNIEFTAGDGSLLLYNTKSGAFISILPENRELIKTLMAEPNYQREPGGFLDNLIEGGFIVYDNVAEYEEVLQAFKKGIEAEDMVLTVMPAETCNFRCSYCYEELRHITMSAGVRRGIVNFVKRLPVEIRSLHVAWYGGEPTLAKNTVVQTMADLNSIAKTRDMKIDGRMTTNGYLLTKEDFRIYIDHGIRFFQITVDGTKKEHDNLRMKQDGSGTFDTIWHNLRDISDLDGDFIVRVRVNFHRNNYEAVYQFIDLFVNEFGHDKRFYIAFRSIWTGEFERKELPICQIMEGMFLQNKLIHYALAKLGRIEDIQVINPVPRPITTWCEAQRENYFIIGADGKLWKCDLAANHVEESVGILSEDGSLNIDETVHSKWIDPKIYSEDAMCRECKFLPICQGGCAYNRQKGRPICIFNEELMHEAMESRFNLISA